MSAWSTEEPLDLRLLAFVCCRQHGLGRRGRTGTAKATESECPPGIACNGATVELKGVGIRQQANLFRKRVADDQARRPTATLLEISEVSAADRDTDATGCGTSRRHTNASVTEWVASLSDHLPEEEESGLDREEEESDRGRSALGRFLREEVGIRQPGQESAKAALGEPHATAIPAELLRTFAEKEGHRIREFAHELEPLVNEVARAADRREAQTQPESAQRAATDNRRQRASFGSTALDFVHADADPAPAAEDGASSSRTSLSERSRRSLNSSR